MNVLSGTGINEMITKKHWSNFLDSLRERRANGESLYWGFPDPNKKIVAVPKELKKAPRIVRRFQNEGNVILLQNKTIINRLNLYQHFIYRVKELKSWVKTIDPSIERWIAENIFRNHIDK